MAGEAGSYIFQLENMEPFSLDVRQNKAGRVELKLTRGQNRVKLTPRPLELLRLLVANAPYEVSHEKIRQDLGWHQAADATLYRHICDIRKALGDDPNGERFIETLDKAYKFKLKVDTRDNPAGIEALPKWSRARFHSLIEDIERNPAEKSDLRLQTTFFSYGVDYLDLEELVETKRLRIRILMLDPTNAKLVYARFGVNEVVTEADALNQLPKQIDEIRRLKEKYPPTDERTDLGSIDLKLSNLTPGTFLIHTHNAAALGIMLAHASYIVGPMFILPSASTTWRTFFQDWERRWDEAKDPKEVDYQRFAAANAIPDNNEIR